MELTPSQIAGASFRTVRKGYDPEEVDAFLGLAADALEAAQQQATAMEARARAAVARLQEAIAATPAPAPPVEADPTPVEPSVEPSVEQAVEQAVEPEHAVAYEPHLSRNEAETISRTLLLAQHTADTTVAEAEAEAERIRVEAQSEAEATIDSTREMSARLLEQARSEARKATDAERRAAENEVETLKARREFLVGDVDQLEQFMAEQRERLRGAARQIEALVDRVPAGLAQVHPPVLSASHDEPGDDEPGDDEPGDDEHEPGDHEPGDHELGDDEPGDHEPGDHEPGHHELGNDTGELFLPAEAEGPFATVDELAEALDLGETQPIPMPELFSIPDDDQDLSDSADDLPSRRERGAG